MGRARVPAGAERIEAAGGLPVLRVSRRTAEEARLLGEGAYAPLVGFLGEADYRSVLEEMCLADGSLWALPVLLPVSEDRLADLQEGREYLLAPEAGPPAGVLTVTSWFRRDREREARLVYGTLDARHPGVARLLREPEWAVSGPVRSLATEGPSREIPTPAQVRAEMRRRGWRTVAGFQTRNPPHRGHEYAHRLALELVDGLLLHPLVGTTKEDDLPAPVRLEAYRVLVEAYYPPNRILLVAYAGPMYYAGPREAVHHALVRKNYGCTHFLVGRDHAGVGSYYPPLAAQQLLLRLGPERLGIVPLPVPAAFYCRRCAQVVSERTCPHGAGERLEVSGTLLREWLARGEPLPEEMVRPEVAAVLRRAWQGRGE